MLGAGIFMGWSLGTNDAANAFGTAVATGVVKYRTAVIIIAIMVVLGAFLQGSLNLESVNKLAITNAVIPSEEIAREQQTVRISIDSRRYGKTVTVIDGIDENDIDTGDLAKQLKNRCAAGGTCKDGRIELQGDHKKKVKAVLEEMGFRTEVR